MKKIILILFALAAITAAQAQVKIGDNPTTINAGSVLELESTTKGMMLPRISLTSTTDWGLAGTAAAGMTVYNTNALIASGSTSYPANGVCEYFWDGGGWVAKKGIAGSGFAQSFSAPNISTGSQNTWINLINQTITVPRDGKYLILGKVEIAMNSVVNPADNALSKGACALIVDAVSIDASNFAGFLLFPHYTIAMNTTAPLQGVVFLTKGTHVVQVQAIGFYLYNQTVWNFTNAKLTVTATGE